MAHNCQLVSAITFIIIKLVQRAARVRAREMRARKKFNLPLFVNVYKAASLRARARWMVLI